MFTISPYTHSCDWYIERIFFMIISLQISYFQSLIRTCTMFCLMHIRGLYTVRFYMSLQKAGISIKLLLTRVRNNLCAALDTERERPIMQFSCARRWIRVVASKRHSHELELIRGLCCDHQRTLSTKPSGAYESLLRLYYDFKRSRWWALEHIQAFPFRQVPLRLVKIPIFAQH